MAIVEQQAVIDRIEGPLAVLLVGDDERMRTVPVSRMPHGAKEGDWLKIRLTDGEITNVQTDPGETQRRRNLIEAKLDQLRRKKRTT